MATRGRSSSPQNEPFPSLDSGPRTPTSISSTSAVPPVSASGKENPHLIRPRTSELPFSSGPRALLSPKSTQELSPRSSPRLLTGAAATLNARRHKQQQQQQLEQQHQEQHQSESKADSRQTSPNPAVVALNSLMSTAGMSKPSDAPTPANLSGPMRRAAEHLTVPSSNGDESSQSSPVSMANSAINDRAAAPTAMTATTNGTERAQHMVAEPAEMSGPSDYMEAGRVYSAPSAANSAAKAFTYPGPEKYPLTSESQDGPARGSPSTSKRHKCPYCATDFTRHHNLKSHLLTHSQEKPYVCQQCSARFRRLHDLKRHTKLHTGERPHTCDKCGRKFARGDALARHNKGPGGCAGRRSSFGDNDDGTDDRIGDDGMDVDYPDQEDEGESPDSSGRRESEPSRKRTHLEAPHDSGRTVYRQHSSTYPPVATGALRSSMGPPTGVVPSSSTVPSPGELPNLPSPVGGNASSQYYGAPPGLVFGQAGGMTESPKPLSPGQQDQHRLSIAEVTNIRNRSPSLTQHLQQQQYGRGAGQHTPPMTGHVPSQHAPQLPSLPGLAADSVRLGHQTRLPLTSAGPSMLQHQLSSNHIPGSNPGSLSSQGRSSGGSLREMAASSEPDVWNYVRMLEQRFSRMQDEYELRMSRMQEEIISLKQHAQSR